jgi:hypothetical protein
MAITRPRSPSGNTASTIVADTGIISAAPAPCSARNPMIDVVSQATAQPAEARKNSVTPIWNARTLPSRSAARPPSATRAARASM